MNGFLAIGPAKERTVRDTVIEALEFHARRFELFTGGEFYRTDAYNEEGRSFAMLAFFGPRIAAVCPDHSAPPRWLILDVHGVADGFTACSVIADIICENATVGAMLMALQSWNVKEGKKYSKA